MKKLIPLFATLSLLSACGKDSKTGSGETVEGLKAKTEKGVDQAKDAVAHAVDEFEKSAHDSLSKIDEEIAELRAKAKEAGADAKADLQDSLAGLESKRKELAQELSELKSAAPEKAKTMLEKLKTSLASLKRSAEDAVARFR